MPGSLLGNAVRRVEDPDLLMGRGTFIDNLRIDGLLRVAFVRSPMAHAAIRSIDTSDAATMPGVVAVYIAGDLNLAPIPPLMAALHEATARPPLSTANLPPVGEPVAALLVS